MLGLMPVQIVAALNSVTSLLIGAGVAQHSPRWWLLSPLTGASAAYGPIVFFLGVLLVVLFTVYGVRVFYHARIRRSAPWDCGFGTLNARMQDTAEGFGQPIRHVFGPFFRVRRQLPTPFDRSPSYGVVVTDRIWHWFYEPLATLVRSAANAVAWLQQGRVTTYLLYSFVTLLALLGIVLV